MSFDLAVWYLHERLTDEEALQTYVDICNGDISRLQPHPSIDTFYLDLASYHPEIDTVPEDKIDDFDFCPWSVAHDRSDRHTIMCSVWSKSEHVTELVHELARKHGLAVFNPQIYQISYPDIP